MNIIVNDAGADPEKELGVSVPGTRNKCEGDHLTLVRGCRETAGSFGVDAGRFGVAVNRQPHVGKLLFEFRVFDVLELHVLAQHRHASAREQHHAGDEFGRTRHQEFCDGMRGMQRVAVAIELSARVHLAKNFLRPLITLTPEGIGLYKRIPL